MNGKVLLDTNIVIALFAEDEDKWLEAEKKAYADLFERAGWV